MSEATEETAEEVETEETETEMVQDSEEETELEGEAEEESDNAKPEDEEFSISLDGDSPPQETPEWVKNTRRENRELNRRIKELEAQLGGSQSKPLGPEPTLESCDYDTDEYKKQYADWHSKKLDLAKKEEEVLSEQKKQQEEWNGVMNSYQSKKSELPIKDFEEAEQIVGDTLSVAQQSILLQAADNPATMVYALYKNPKKLNEIANETNPILFTKKLSKLEGLMKITQKKPDTKPEKTITGTAPVSSDKTLDRLEKEAEKTGDRSKIVRYKQQLRQKQRSK